MNWTSPAFRNLVRGQPCYLDVPGVCNRQPETVVPCHSNLQRHGHGASLRAHDVFTVPGCSDCHCWLDQGRDSRAAKEQVFMSAWERWMLYLVSAGLLVVGKGRQTHRTGYQPGSKVMPRRCV